MTDASPTRSQSQVVLVATLVAVLMIAAQVAGKATRDAFFLTHYPARDLPLVMIGAALLAVALVLSMSRALARFTPARVVPLTFALHAALFVGEWGLAFGAPRVVAVVLYLHLTALGAVTISAFWSLINERFDPHTAKEVIGRIAGGAVAGGVVGGVAAWQLARVVSLPVLLLVLGGLNAVGAVLAARIGPGPGAAAKEPGAASSGLNTLRRVPYLRHLGALVALVAITEAVVDYVFKASASTSFSGADLVSFFAIFHMATGAATFLLQSAVAGRALRTLGLGGTVATLPLTVLAAGVAALVYPVLWSVVALRGAGAVVQNSLFRSGYELLYTPVPPREKRPTKAIIDVGFDKAGGALGGGLALLAVWTLPERSGAALLMVALGAAAAALVLSRTLQRGYVAELARSLRSGALSLEAEEVVDLTTQRTLAETTAGLNREKLLRGIAALRAEGTAGGVPGAAPAPRGSPSPGDGAPPPLLDPLTRAFADLISGDPERARRVLRERAPLDPELVGPTLGLLADPSLAPAATTALRRVAPAITGQLVDALWRQESDLTIRRSLPRILRASATQRATDGLVGGLRDPAPEVRYACGAALLSITGKDPTLSVDPEKIFTAARHEIERGGATTAAYLPSADAEGNPFADEAALQHLGRHLAHAFTLLALVLDREPVHLAFLSLASSEAGLRGTALEYLDNVLPADLRAALEPFLEDQQVVRSTSRPHREVLADLMASREALRIDPKALGREE